MLALRKLTPKAGLDLVQVAEPDPCGPGEVLIDVAATGICGSDLSIEKWSAMYDSFMARALPVTLGHELSGRVSAVGDGVTTPAVGDAVVVNPAVSCGSCQACFAGDAVGCTDRQAIGMVSDGAFAARVKVPANYCYALPSNVPVELGALVEPLSVGAHALKIAGLTAGQSVLIFGPGPVGQGAALMARHMGASSVTIVGMNDGPRLAQLARMGFASVIDMADKGAAEALRRATGDGFDIAIEASGAPPVVDQALACLRPEGILSVASLTDQPVTFDMLRVVRNRLQIRGASRIPPAIWPLVIEALAADPDRFALLVTHRLPLDQAHEGFELSRRGEASKVLLFPQQ